MNIRLVAAVAEHITQQKAKIELAELDEDQLSNRKMVADVITQVRTCHKSLISVATRLFDLVANTVVFLITLSVGIYINWVIMAIIAGVGAILSVCFIVIWHAKSYKTANELEQATVASRDYVAELKGLPLQNTSPETKRQMLSSALYDLGPVLSKVTHIQRNANSSATMFIDFGQSIIIVTFLATLIGQIGVDRSQIADIIILALLLRFLVAYMKSIVQNVTKLSSFYTFVFNLRKRLSKGHCLVKA